MDIIRAARDIGKAIQEDEVYKNMKAAEKEADADLELQELIGNFNLKRIAINNEASKEDKSEDKLKQLNEEMRTIYADVMKNEHMAAYQQAKVDFDALVQRVMAIITNSAQGDDPETTDISSSCSGDCSSCGGCH